MLELAFKMHLLQCRYREPCCRNTLHIMTLTMHQGRWHLGGNTESHNTDAIKT